MGEQVTDRHLILQAAGELGDVLGDRIVEAELPLVVEHHDGGGRADDLAEAREIVDRAIGRDRAARRRPIDAAEALLPDRGALAADDDGRTGIATGI